jgi:hypothetical protein
MKKMLRALLVCLALVMCLTPVLVACDHASESGDEIDASSVEGTFIAKAPNKDKTLTLKLYQLEEADGKDTVKCSLVLYKNEDNTILNYEVFDLKVNGQKVGVLSLAQAFWTDDHVEATMTDADGKKTVYNLSYQK